MSDRRLTAAIAILALAAHFTLPPADAATREYEFAIERRKIDIGGSEALGLTVNGGIPGPTLRFTEGDLARIHVRRMRRKPPSTGTTCWCPPTWTAFL
jgi:FtsP/CotA-like multicopper oxidase with cupredoxin domain